MDVPRPRINTVGDHFAGPEREITIETLADDRDRSTAAGLRQSARCVVRNRAPERHDLGHRRRDLIRAYSRRTVRGTGKPDGDCSLRSPMCPVCDRGHRSPVKRRK